jgi:hypothetical protein
MEDCGGEGYAEEEEEQYGQQQTGCDNHEQHPDNEEWWEGQEHPPTMNEYPLPEEDMGRCCPDQRN